MDMDISSLIVQIEHMEKEKRNTAEFGERQDIKFKISEQGGSPYQGSWDGDKWPKKIWDSYGLISTASAPYLKYQVIGVSRVMIIFGHRVPNIRKVGINRPYHALLIYYMVGCTGILMMRGVTSVVNMVIQAICLKNFPLARVLQEKERLR